MSNLKARRGRIIIDSSIFEKMDDFTKLLESIFSVFIPVHVDEYYSSGHWRSKEYYGYSRLFDLVDDNTLAPLYAVLVRTDDKGNITSIEFNKD